MARGGRGGRRGNQQPASVRGGGMPRPARRRRGRGGDAAADMPTAMPGASGAPASIFGGNVTAPVGPPRPGSRSRGGPRSSAERRRARGMAISYDFRYVRSDLVWISLTTLASVAVILAIWAAIRL